VGTKLNIIGETYGQLTIIKEVASTHKYARNYVCKCICGNTTIVSQSHLRSGHTTSCGCKARLMRKTGSLRKTHGKSRTNLYKVWVQMKQRCNNPKDASYYKYGATGIKVDDSWDTFEPFAEWSKANGYIKGLTIDRENGNLGYSPTNCRWVNSSIQAINTKLSTKNTTGYKGINIRNNKYIVRVTNKGKRVQVGAFTTLNEAVKARDNYYTDQFMSEHLKARKYE